MNIRPNIMKYMLFLRNVSDAKATQTSLATANRTRMRLSVTVLNKIGHDSRHRRSLESVTGKTLGRLLTHLSKGQSHESARATASDR